MTKKYDVVVQPFEYPKSRIYITLGYNFGFALNYYKVGGKIFQLNPAAILFLAYFKKEFAKKQLRKKVDILTNPGNTLLSLVTTEDKIQQDIQKLNRVLTYVPEKNFNELKNIFISDHLRQQNEKNNMFNLTILEFLGQNKRFSRYNLYNNVKALNFNEVIQVQKFLFENMKCNIHIVGNYTKNEYGLLYESLDKPQTEVYTESIFYPMAPPEKVAKEILVKEGERYVLLLHSNITVEINQHAIGVAQQVFLTYQILAEKYRHQNPILSMDGAEFGMIIPGISRIYSKSFSDEKLSKYILNIKQQANYLIEEKPKLYSELFVTLWLSGIDYFDYYNKMLTQPIDVIQNTVQTVLENSLYCNVKSN